MTFLFTDIEGSTRLLRNLGRDRYGEVLSVHHRLLRVGFAEAGGIEIDSKGDSFFVVFRSARGAVAAAGSAQRALVEHAWPEGVDLRVRMGLHTGEASISSDGYIGLAVHEAARISRERREQIDGSALVGDVGRAVMVATLRYFDARRGVDREAVRRLAKPQTLEALVDSMPSVAISCAATALLYAELDHFFERMIEASRERGELVTLSNMLCFRGLARAQRGELEAALRDLRDSDDLVPYLTSQQGAIYYRSYVADVLTNMGEVDEAEQVLAELALPENVPQSGHMIFFLGARGWIRLARGDFDEACSDYSLLGECMEAFEMRNPAMLAWRSHLALALLGLERREEALELAREEVELARTWGAPRALGVALRTQGQAETGDERIATLRESLAVLQGSSAALQTGRTVVQLGAALGGEEGRGLLAEGLELARACGSRPLIDEAEVELATAGVFAVGAE